MIAKKKEVHSLNLVLYTLYCINIRKLRLFYHLNVHHYQTRPTFRISSSNLRSSADKLPASKSAL